MKYMSYGVDGFVMSIDEAEDISSVNQNGIYALDGYSHPVAVHIMEDDEAEDNADDSIQIFYCDNGKKYLIRELKNNFCNKDYHLEKENKEEAQS